MVESDIESLGLVAYDETSAPSLRVFHWQDVNGEAFNEPKKKKKNKLV